MKITKTKLVQSILAASAAVFITISPVLANDVVNNINIPAPTFGIFDIGTLISRIIRFAMVIAVILAFIFLIWGGIQWITSGGDKSANEAARNRITAALVGLAIVAASWAIITLASQLLNIPIITKEGFIGNFF
jgi:hypothetical protein